MRSIAARHGGIDILYNTAALHLDVYDGHPIFEPPVSTTAAMRLPGG